jgi:hypothetical protein
MSSSLLTSSSDVAQYVSNHWTAGPTIQRRHNKWPIRNQNDQKEVSVVVPGCNKSLYYQTAFWSLNPPSRGQLSGCHLPPGPPFTAQHPHPHTPFLSSSKLTPRFELETCLSTTLKSDSSHGSSSGPILLNPYSSSAKWRSCLKAGWLRYAVRTINRWELTDTTTCPAGTSELCPAEAAARALHRRSIWRRRTMQWILLLHFDPIFRFWFWFFSASPFG